MLEWLRQALFKASRLKATESFLVRSGCLPTLSPLRQVSLEGEYILQ